MTTATEERCCARCLFHHAFPWYVRGPYEGYCRRPEVYEVRTEEEHRTRPLFIRSSRHQCCPLFRDAAEFYASVGIDIDSEEE